MARYTLALLVALVAQQVAAVPIVFPTSLLSSLTITNIPLPTGAKLDHVPRKEDFTLTLSSTTLTGFPLPLPTDAKKHKPDFTLTLSSTTLTGFPLPLPTDAKRDARDLSLTLPSLSVSPTIGIPTGLPSLSLSVTIPTSIDLPTYTGTLLEKRTLSPAVPIGTATGFPSGLPPPPPPPTGFPSGPFPTGPAPTGPVPTGAPRYPGGLLQPDN